MTEPTEDRFGPIDFVVVEFPGGEPTPKGFEVLLDKVDRGTIRLLDLELVTKADGEVTIADVGSFDLDVLAAFEGASSGLLDDTDLDDVGEQMAEGSAAVVVVYEELSVLAALEAWESEGARLALEGHLTPVDLVEALDGTEPEQ